MSGELPEPELSLQAMNEILAEEYGMSSEQSEVILGSDPETQQERFGVFLTVFSRLEDSLVDSKTLHDTSTGVREPGEAPSKDESRSVARMMFFGELNETMDGPHDRLTSPFEVWRDENPVRAMEVVINHLAGEEQWRNQGSSSS
jgi:hypothetical protein